nr:E3 ubiquitin-protein ligase RNF182-like [Ipomoea batatas]
MWRSISSAIAGFGQKKDCAEARRACDEFSDDDDEICSNDSGDEGLECPICWESFNIVENVPYVLWCGHSICKNCLLGLKWAALKISAQQIQVPLFISCPWCNLLTFRLVYKGNLRIPSKNFFLLWMVESRNGDRVKSPLCTDHQQAWPPRCTSAVENSPANVNHRRPHAHTSATSASQRPHFSLHKSLDFFLRFTSNPVFSSTVFCISRLALASERDNQLNGFPSSSYFTVSRSDLYSLVFPGVQRSLFVIINPNLSSPRLSISSQFVSRML